jgi:hypothetical protein
MHGGMTGRNGKQTCQGGMPDRQQCADLRNKNPCGRKISFSVR